MAQVHMRIADRRSRRFVPLLAALGFALAGLATVLAAGASLAADEVDADYLVSWSHSSKPGDVSRFVLFVAPQEGAVGLARRIPVDSNSSSWAGPIAVGDYIAVSAIGRNGIQSALSDWRQAKSSDPSPSDPSLSVPGTPHHKPPDS
jgi:hypothetical protein